MPYTAKHTPRTPEGFEELVVGHDRDRIAPVLGISMLSYKRLITNLEDMLGRDRLMLVSQDDLQYRTRDTMDRVFTFLGLEPIDSPKFNTIINSASSKGATSVSTNVQPGQYANGLYLTDKAQQHLVDIFREDCEWLRDERDVHFDASC